MQISGVDPGSQVKNLDALGDRVGSIRRGLTDEQKERVAQNGDIKTKITSTLDATLAGLQSPSL